MNRAAILDTAKGYVTKDRAKTHGSAERNFGRVAAIWSIRVGVTITDAHVALMLVDLKSTRAWDNPGHLDSWVDIAGYAACGGEIATQDAGHDDLVLGRCPACGDGITRMMHVCASPPPVFEEPPCGMYGHMGSMDE